MRLLKKTSKCRSYLNHRYPNRFFIENCEHFPDTSNSKLGTLFLFVPNNSQMYLSIKSECYQVICNIFPNFPENSLFYYLENLIDSDNILTIQNNDHYFQLK
jgi:hypothetical protein